MNELNKNFNEIAIGFAENHYSSKFKLDFSEKSIQYLDTFIEDLSNTYLSKDGEASFETRLILGCAGIYLGEVIKKKVDSLWIKENNDFILDAGQIKFNPVGKVFKRFFQGEEDSVYGFYIVCMNNHNILNSLKAQKKPV